MDLLSSFKEEEEVGAAGLHYLGEGEPIFCMIWLSLLLILPIISSSPSRPSIYIYNLHIIPQLQYIRGRQYQRCREPGFGEKVLEICHLMHLCVDGGHPIMAVLELAVELA